LLIAAATLVSEDLTCITTGLLVARGTIGFLPGTIACLAGIFAGDLGLFFTGRILGRRVLGWPPLSWLIRREEVEAACDWFSRRGPALVLGSRFVPGTRLPTYVAAGILHTGVWTFSFWFLLGALLWTPLLVGASAVFGIPVVPLFARYHGQAWIVVAIAGLLLYLVLHLVVPLFTFQGRRLLVSRWRRLTRWEFWPPWVFYPPVAFYVVYLGIRHRGITLFTAVNPAIPGGGFVGESKAAILAGLGTDSPVARFELIPVRLPVEERLSRVADFLRRHGLELPVVLKPDTGERGSGVAVIRSPAELEAYLRQAGSDTMVQEYVAGEEFGVFYYRLPGEEQGRIFSITRKKLPGVTGDGVGTLRELILGDARAVSMAPLFLRRHARRLLEVPASGEWVSLGDVGNHCRGAEFYDGIGVRTPELEGAIDRLSRRYQGFDFGRYDIRTPSVADLREGRNFTVLELNGATSEATHIYDPANSLFRAYATLFEQWRILFRIAAYNRSSGVRPLSLGELLTSLLEHRRRVTLHPAG
ncbi:MAG: VTT domain-containing protein, partial [Gemmatimonadales bacterium]